MSKPKLERPVEASADPGVAPLAAGIRRHLGQNLRALYADTLAAPLTQRLETLMAQLDKTKR